MEIIKVDSKHVTYISTQRHSFQGNWSSTEIKKIIKPSLRRLKESSDGVPLLDPVKNMKITNPVVVSAMKEIDKITEK